MKKNYMVSNTKPFRKAEATVAKVLDQQIHETFQYIKDNPNVCEGHIERLRDLLLKRKKACSLTKELKTDIFKYFLEKELKEMNIVRRRDLYTLKILKLTSTKLKDYHLQWKEILSKFEKSFEETQKISGLYEFLSLIRQYFDPNALVDVLEHFKGKYRFSNEMTWLYMNKFISITAHTTH